MLTACPQPGTVTPRTPPEHRIGLRVVAGQGEFYDKLTGATFVLRGGNYNRWTWQSTPGRGPFLMDMLFNAFDDQLAEAAVDLDAFAAQGLNTVRVWIDACDVDVGGCIGNPAGGLRDANLDHITTFLEMLAARGLYVIFTMNEVPDDGGYGAANASQCCDEFFGYNLSYLTPGGRDANRMFFRDFIRGLVARGAATDRILAYELRNEPFFERNYPPFSLTRGTIETANGKSYDLADAADRQRMMDENMVDWVDEMAAVIRAEDPTALVTIGYFHPLGPDSDWLANASYIVANSSLDFFAHHAYPDGDKTYWDGYVDAFELNAYPPEKPLVLGEFGVGKITVPSLEDAAMMIQRWQVESCAVGVSGWLHWTYSSGGVTIPDLWVGTEAGGVINAALAPANRPDPCAPGPEMTDHKLLSYHRPATASQQGSERYRAARAVDLSMDSWWSADDGPPQWIEIDLEGPREIGRVRVPISFITPAGQARVKVWAAGTALGGELLVHEFDQVIAEGDELVHTFDPPLAGVERVRFEVTEMQGWVILSEVEVWAP